MDTKRLAFFYIFLFSAEYLESASAHCPVVKPPPHRGCQVSAELEWHLGQCVNQWRLLVKDQYETKDVVSGNYKCHNGRISGCKNIRYVGCRCTCYDEFIRVYVELELTDLLFSFVLSLNGILNGLLFNVINALVKLLKDVVDLVLHLLAARITVVVILDQDFSGGPVRVHDVYVDSFGEVTILGLNLTGVLNLLMELLRPVLQTVLTALISNDLRSVFNRAFAKLVILEKWHNCHRR